MRVEMMPKYIIILVVLSFTFLSLSCEREIERGSIGGTVIEIKESDHKWSGKFFKHYQVVRVKVFLDRNDNCDEEVDIYFELINNRNASFYDREKIELYDTIIRVGSKVYLGGDLINGNKLYPDIHIENIDIKY